MSTTFFIAFWLLFHPIQSIPSKCIAVLYQKHTGLQVNLNSLEIEQMHVRHALIFEKGKKLKEECDAQLQVTLEILRRSDPALAEKLLRDLEKIKKGEQLDKPRSY
jgi:hypothetical protein